MRVRASAATAAMMLIVGGAVVVGQRVALSTRPSVAPASSAVAAPRVTRSVLPSESNAKTLLNTTSRHPEWIGVPAGTTTIRTFVVYPERADRAPVVLVTSNTQGLSDLMRAVGDQLAGEGFVSITPDFLSGRGPRGGDTDSFASQQAVASALRQMGRKELQRRATVMRSFAVSHPAGNGTHAVLDFVVRTSGDALIEATVDSTAGTTRASFPLTQQAWPGVIAFLTQYTDNHFTPVAEIALAHNHADHSGHALMPGMPMAQETPAVGGGNGGKRADLPGNWRTHQMQLRLSPRRKEWVDIPMGTTRLHTWVVYPQGEVKAGVVVVMHGGPGMDTWNQGIADQLAYHGFIAVAPDLLSGLGPNGGGSDSFELPDDLNKALSRLTPADMMRRYVAARDWALKLPQSNGKSGSMGFCLGGGNSWRFAAEPGVSAAVSFYGGQPDLDTIAKIHAPVIAFFGQLDLGLAPRIAPATAQMKAAGKAFEVHVYEKGTHSFLNRQDLAENLKATEDSWPRAIAFLKQHLN